MKGRHKLAAALAVIGLVQAQAASAQNCVTEEQLSAMLIYMTPTILTAVNTVCEAELEADGFLATGSPDLIERYAAAGTENWALAKEAFYAIAASREQARPGRAQRSAEDEEMAVALLKALPDETLQSLIETSGKQILGPQIQPDKCGEIERLTEVLATMEPNTAGKLIAVIVNLSDVRNPSICKVRG